MHCYHQNAFPDNPIKSLGPAEEILLFCSLSRERFDKKRDEQRLLSDQIRPQYLWVPLDDFLKPFMSSADGLRPICFIVLVKNSQAWIPITESVIHMPIPNFPL